MSEKTRRGIDWNLAEIEASESLLVHFWSSKRWGYSKFISLILATLAIAIPVFVIYRGVFPTFNTRVERSLIVTLLLLFAFLKYPAGKRKWSERPGWLFIVDIVFVLLTIGTETYTLYSELIERLAQTEVSLLGHMVGADYIIGWIMVILVLEATRRTFGWVLICVPVVFISYSLTANWWPGPLFGAKASWDYLALMIYGEQVGIFGTGTEVLLSMVFIFLLFGSLMASTRVGAFFSALAIALVGRYSGGPAKVAVFASCLFGSLSGSAVANVATTGVITIPMMKRIGLKPEFAAAVEATASSGGYFTPPIMGAAAFLIAAYADIPYLKVCLYAALPAGLYYLGLLVQIHARAKRSGLVGLPKDEIPSASRVLIEGVHLLFPAVMLIAALAMGYSITRVAILGTAAVLLVSFFDSNTRQNPREILVMFERALSDTIGISLAMVTVGIIEGAAIVSGFGTRLSELVGVLSGGSLILGLIIAGVVLMILGMGVNPLLVYYMGYIFILPALVKLGAAAIPVHIFMLIYGGLANITPPVAMASFAAANIARSNPWKTGWQAVRLGFAAYIVPFMLVLQPALLFLPGTTVSEAVLALVATTVGISCLAIAFEGWAFRNVRVWERLLIAVCGLLQLSPYISLRGVGFLLFALVAVWLRFTARRAFLLQEAK